MVGFLEQGWPELSDFSKAEATVREKNQQSPFSFTCSFLNHQMIILGNTLDVQVPLKETCCRAVPHSRCLNKASTPFWADNTEA